jgi:O-antigen ligase
MPPLIATILVTIGIIGLFVLDRDSEARTSKALWIPFIYLFIVGSRSLSIWFGVLPPIVSPPASPDGIYTSPADRDTHLVLLASGLMALVTRRRKVGSLLRTSGPILLFFSYAGLSILWSDFPYVTLKHWTKGVEDVVMALIVLTDGDPVMAVKRLLARAGFLLIPLSLLYCKYYPSQGRLLTKSWTFEYVGVTTTKNQLGMVCLIFGLGSLWCFLRAYRERERPGRARHLLAHGAVLGIAVYLLQMCHSLTSSVCLVLAGGVMVLASARSPDAKAAKVHLSAAAALCIALFPLFVAPSLVELLGRTTTFSGRTEIWRVLPGLVRNPWLGAGYETFLLGPRLIELRRIFDYTFQEAHNGYLEVYLNLGWIGVSLLALLLITGYQKVVAALRRDPAVGSLNLAFFVAVVTEGLTEAAFRMMMLSWFSLLLAIIGAPKTIPPEPSLRKADELAECEGPAPALGSAEVNQSI